LAWSKPVLTVADEQSELVHALREGNFGVNVPPGNPAKLCEALEALSADRGKLNDYAIAGRRYVSQFEMDKVLAGFCAELENLVAGPQHDRRVEVAPAVLARP
jgi:hypothetical protein